MGVGFLLLINAVEVLNESYFVFISFCLYFLLLLELVVTSNHYHIEHRKNTNAKYFLEHHKVAQYLHHISVPSLLYFGLVLFLYFNSQPSVYLLIIILSTVLFGILFENIYSFYHHSRALLKSTNYIYDVISGISVFLWTDVLLTWQRSEDLNPAIIVTLLIMVLGYFGVLALSRHVFVLEFLVGLGVLLTGYMLLIGLVLDITQTSVLFLSIFTTGAFIIFNGLLTHYLEKTLTKSVLYEYLLMYMIVFSLIYAYSS